MFKKTIFKWLIILSALAGVYLQMFASSVDFMGGTSMMLYFTIQSNLWMAMIAAVGLIYIYRDKEMKEGYFISKYTLTVGILITYVVFSILLTPSLPLSYLLTPSNILVHTLTPIVSILDYLLNDRRIYRKKLYLFGLITPLYYMIFAYIMYAFGIKFSGSNFPYFFLDFIDNGWLTISDGKIGVVYWYIFILGLVLLISASSIKLKKIIDKKVPIYVASTMIVLTFLMTLLQAIS
ncbi:Pr6Pr family membrane protein [Acholeplasma hippikon]|uniref:Uncharacterized protein n=1 Tax=Acholeplasma hippikon TaxID=264636 RepID=A0A449BIH1_9MOLU|nr:Pr6Pr family membrane protein [Acholeplasma hippikon]VEU82261.1 Uncharacterised protein [Acholeplasma hippikon]